jgi:hypothetical protein
MSDFKLTPDQRAEAEKVMEDMGGDPDAMAYELVYLRHENERLSGVLRVVAEGKGLGGKGPRAVGQHFYQDLAKNLQRLAAHAIENK